MKPLSLGCQIIVHWLDGLVFDGGQREAKVIIGRHFLFQRHVEGMKCTQEHCIG